MEYSFFDVLCSGIGRMYLFFRYRKKEKREEILKADFDNSYSQFGKVIVVQIIGSFFLIILLGFLIIAIWRSIFPVN